MNLRATAPLEVSTPGVTVLPLASGKWRVSSRSGALLGHVESVDGGGYRAMRFSIRERGFRSLGEFPTAQRATDALRFV